MKKHTASTVASFFILLKPGRISFFFGSLDEFGHLNNSLRFSRRVTDDLLMQPTLLFMKESGGMKYKF